MGNSQSKVIDIDVVDSSRVIVVSEAPSVNNSVEKECNEYDWIESFYIGENRMF